MKLLLDEHISGKVAERLRVYVRANRLHHGLVIVLSARIPSGEFARLTAALAALLDGPDLGPSFVVWLQSVDPS